MTNLTLLPGLAWLRSKKCIAFLGVTLQCLLDPELDPNCFDQLALAELSGAECWQLHIAESGAPIGSYPRRLSLSCANDVVSLADYGFDAIVVPVQALQNLQTMHKPSVQYALRMLSQSGLPIAYFNTDPRPHYAFANFAYCLPGADLTELTEANTGYQLMAGSLLKEHVRASHKAQFGSSITHDLLLPVQQLTDERTSFILQYAEQRDIACWGPGNETLASATGGAICKSTDKLIANLSTSAGSLMLLTPEHIANGMLFTMRFWQILVSDCHMLIPACYAEAFYSAPECLLTYSAKQTHAMLQLWRHGKAYRQYIKAAQQAWCDALLGL